MAHNPKFSTAAVNAKANAQAALLNGGFLDIYDGVQPASADTPLSGQNLLASLGFGNPAFSGASVGVVVANPITSDPSASATGTASWFRSYESDHLTAVVDGTVGTANADAIINNTSINIGALVKCTGVTLGESQG